MFALLSPGVSSHMETIPFVNLLAFLFSISSKNLLQAQAQLNTVEAAAAAIEQLLTVSAYRNPTVSHSQEHDIDRVRQSLRVHNCSRQSISSLRNSQSRDKLRPEQEHRLQFSLLSSHL